jgi:GH24 family phage-related lysozyme (muramidase)
VFGLKENGGEKKLHKPMNENKKNYRFDPLISFTYEIGPYFKITTNLFT